MPGNTPIGYRKDEPVEISDMIHLYRLANSNRARRRITIHEVHISSIPTVSEHASEERHGRKKRSVQWRDHDVSRCTRTYRLTAKLESMHELGHAHLNAISIVEAHPARAAVGGERAIAAIEEFREPWDSVLGHQRLERGLMLDRIDPAHTKARHRRSQHTVRQLEFLLIRSSDWSAPGRTQLRIQPKAGGASALQRPTL